MQRDPPLQIVLVLCGFEYMFSEENQSRTTTYSKTKRSPQHSGYTNVEFLTLKSLGKSVFPFFKLHITLSPLDKSVPQV